MLRWVGREHRRSYLISTNGFRERIQKETGSLSVRPKRHDQQDAQADETVAETCAMSNARTIINEHESRLTAITTIGLEVKALVFDEGADEIVYTNDARAEKLLYARAFQAWADGKIEGSADDIFETVQEVLEM
jgi:hypothetical protein